MNKPWDETCGYLLRELAPQVLGVLSRRFRDFASAEDAVQEAMIAAFRQWPQEGMPDNPRGWLIQVASRRMADQARSEIARRERETTVARDAESATLAFDIDSDLDPDDTLILLFMCCHPALSPSSAIALTLRAVGGLTTAEIARAFLVPEATMAQRISRAKQSIRDSGVPFRLPSPEERAQRLSAVLHVLYLIFNEGYASSIGAHLQRLDLSREAIRLTRNTKTLTPDHAEVTGLLALMLLTDARRAARSGPDEELIPLERQDRRLWDRAEIAEGLELLTAALSKGSVGFYQLQAAIAAVHAGAPSAAATDWTQIAALYSVLERVEPSPVVELNRAVAVAMRDGPEAGLELVDAILARGELRDYHLVHSARADLCRRLGRKEEARASYERALSLARQEPERRFLERRLSELRE